MYLVLHRNVDPYCGSDYTWCENIKDVIECIDLWNGEIFHIYNMKNKKDIKYLFLDKETGEKYG